MSGMCDTRRFAESTRWLSTWVLAPSLLKLSAIASEVEVIGGRKMPTAGLIMESCWGGFCDAIGVVEGVTTEADLVN